jgi:putative endonuclease
MAYVYILKTKAGRYYVGSTGDLEQRLEQHRQGEVKTTRVALPIELVYAEAFLTRGEAQKKEYRIKRWKSKKLIGSLIEKSRLCGPIV